MPRSATSLVLADHPDARVERVAAALGADIVPLAEARRMWTGPGLAVAFAPRESWGPLLWRTWSFRPLSLVIAPIGEPAPPPRWHSRIARFLFPAQAAARRWLPHLSLGRLVVVEPGPRATTTTDGVFLATHAHLYDPEPLVAAAAGGAAIVSTVAHSLLPPGAIVTEAVADAVAALRADPARRASLGRLAADWATRGRTPEAEAASIRAIAAEITSMSTRGGRSR